MLYYGAMSAFVISPLVGDGMVLQQGVSVPLWGKAEPGTWVYARILEKEYRAKTGADGRWRVAIAGQPAGGPYDLEISALGERRVFVGVCFGDVWVCAGQSNMEMPMQRLRDNYPEEWEGPVNSLVRQFKVPQEWDFAGPRSDLSDGRWQIASRESLQEFSGTAWFFAKEITKNRDVPIGLINTAWGGTPVEAWMSRDALAAFPEKIAASEKHVDLAAQKALAQESEAAVKAWHDALAVGDRGLAEKWHESHDAFAQAGRITLPGSFSNASVDNLLGSVWISKQFEATAEFARSDSRLWLGTITDADTVYVNGVEVGGTTYRYPPRKYAIPAGLLREGKNSIVIRVVCLSGDGGVTEGKDFRFFTKTDSIDLGGVWSYRIGMRALKPCPEAFFFQRVPMGLYNAMISPLLDFPCKGILWYQAESNDASPEEYKELFAAHVADWQSKWMRSSRRKSEKLPFLFVQLPIWKEPSENNEEHPWAILRDAQSAALSLPATGMAAALDLGEWNDLHPLNKKEVGRRLALAAERVVFKNENTSPGPLLREVRESRGKLTLRFSNCGEGLVARESPHVTVVAEGKRHRLPARIDGADRVLVDITSTPNPERVLYAWADNPCDRQLCNSDGLPAIPFRAEIKRACADASPVGEPIGDAPPTGGGAEAETGASEDTNNDNNQDKGD